jgi:hypothetical protein
MFLTMPAPGEIIDGPGSRRLPLHLSADWAIDAPPNWMRRLFLLATSGDDASLHTPPGASSELVRPSLRQPGAGA